MILSQTILEAFYLVLLLITVYFSPFAYVVVQFYPCFKFYFALFQTHYHTLAYPRTTGRQTLILILPFIFKYSKSSIKPTAMGVVKGLD